MGVLKATLKNGIVEFFNNWQSYLDLKLQEGPQRQLTMSANLPKSKT